MGLVTPNTIPVLEANSDTRTSLSKAEWSFDSGLGPITSLQALDQNKTRASISVQPRQSVTAGSPFSGEVVVSITDGVTGALTAARMRCGSGQTIGNFTDVRDPGCESVSINLAARTFSFANASVTHFDDINSTLANTTPFSLNGTLRWSDLAAKPGTTVSRATAAACRQADAALPSPPWAPHASCLAGTYVGTSNKGTACTVVVSDAATATPNITSQIDGVSHSFPNLSNALYTNIAAFGLNLFTNGFNLEASSPGSIQLLQMGWTNAGFYSERSAQAVMVRFTHLRGGVPPTASAPAETHQCHVVLE